MAIIGFFAHFSIKIAGPKSVLAFMELSPFSFSFEDLTRSVLRVLKHLTVSHRYVPGTMGF